MFGGSYAAVAVLRRGLVPVRRSNILLTPITSSFSSQKPSSSSSGNNNAVWQAATLVVVGATFFGVSKYLNEPWSSTDEEKDTNEPIMPPQAAITSRAYFDVSIDQAPAGRIVLGLHGNVVPKTVHNFETLCRGNEKMGNVQLSYEQSSFHRIIPGFMIQGGDFTQHNGTGGRSIYGTVYDGRFEDESFQLKHKGVGILSMANAGKNTNGSQFFITTGRTPHLDGRHVVFGVVEEGWSVVKAIEACGSSSGTPKRRCVITKAGVLERNAAKATEKSP